MFGAAPGTYQTHRVGTTDELEALWRRENFTDSSALQVSNPLQIPTSMWRTRPDTLQLVELCVAQDDAPSNLVSLARALHERNA